MNKNTSQEKVKLMHRFKFFAGVLISIFSFTVLSNSNIASADGITGDADRGGIVTSTCGATWCYNRVLGAMWVSYPVTKDHMKVSEAMGNPPNQWGWRGGDGYIDNCKGSNVYVFGRAYYYTKTGEVKYQKAPETFGTLRGSPENYPLFSPGSRIYNSARKFYYFWSGNFANGVGAQYKTDGQAAAAFNAHIQDYWQPKFGYSSINQVAWFCENPTTGSSTVPAPPAATTGDCTHPSANRGNTESGIKVTNSSQIAGQREAEIPRREGSGTVHIFAKPGDSISFYHELCYGVMRVRNGGAGDPWISPDPDRDGHAKDTNLISITINFKAEPDNTFSFHNGINKSNPFGKTITLDGSGTKDKKAHPESLDPYVDGNFVKEDNYGFRVFSPSGLASNYENYECEYAPLQTGGKFYQSDEYVKRSYQIPGAWSGLSCKASNNTGGHVQMAGTLIAQQHTYTETQAWVHWGNNYTGTCGCAWDHSSYQQSWVTTGSKSGNFRSGADAKSNFVEFNSYEASAATPRAWGYFIWARCPDGSENSCGSDLRGPFDHWTDPVYQTGPVYKWEKSSVSFSHDSSDYGHDHYTSMYKVDTSSHGNQTKRAEVYTPYNYITYINAGITDSTEVVYQGETVSSKFGWAVSTRSNSLAGGKLPFYATAMRPGAHVTMIEFIVDRDVPASADAISDDSSHPGSGADEEVCNFFRGKANVVKCGIMSTSTDGTNQRGLYAGDSSGASHTRLVPNDDEFIGDKYCVAAGFWVSNSHNDEPTSDESNRGIGMKGGDHWNITAASCRSIAKKPLFQVWNGSFYTNGSIKTSTSNKYFDATFGLNDAGSYDRTTFGSWDEQAIVAGKDVTGMASGAALGYNHTGTTQFAYGLNYNDLGSNSQDSHGAHPLTISNTGAAGNSQIDNSSQNAALLSQLKTRYRDTVVPNIQKLNGGSTVTGGIYTTNSGMQVAYASGDASLSSFGVNAPDPSDQIAANYNNTSNSGDLVKGTPNGGSHDGSNTLVIYVKGTLTIDEDICLGPCNTEAHEGERGVDIGSTSLSHYNLSFNSISDIPQILIFADNIKIAPQVTRIDAWLIADNGDGMKTGGNINTCDSFGPTTDDVHCSSTLVINGPVFAGTLSLNRTAGNHGDNPNNRNDNGRNDDQTRYVSGINDGSSAPAEIFNLRSDSYLWAFHQSNFNTQFTTTYQRELAPRY